MVPTILGGMVHWDDGVLVVAGEFDMAEADQFRALLDGHHGDLVVDVSGVTFAGSSFLNALIRAVRDGFEIRLLSPQPVLLRLFEVAGLPFSVTLDI